jgi:hypothetical protein
MVTNSNRINRYQTYPVHNTVACSEIVGKTGMICYKTYLHPTDELCDTKSKSIKLVSPIGKITKTLDEKYGICACNTLAEVEVYAVSMEKDLKIMENWLVFCIDHLGSDNKQGERFRFAMPIRMITTRDQAVKRTERWIGDENKIGIVPIAIVFKEVETGSYVIFRTKTSMITRETIIPEDVIFETEQIKYRIELLNDTTALIYNAEKPPEGDG